MYWVICYTFILRVVGKKKKKKHLYTACRYDYVTLYAQSVDLRNPGIILSAQTLDPWFIAQSMDWPRNPGIARAQSIDQGNPGIARAQSIDQGNPGIARAQSIDQDNPGIARAQSISRSVICVYMI